MELVLALFICLIARVWLFILMLMRRKKKKGKKHHILAQLFGNGYYCLRPKLTTSNE